MSKLVQEIFKKVVLPDAEQTAAKYLMASMEGLVSKAGEYNALFRIQQQRLMQNEAVLQGKAQVRQPSVVAEVKPVELPVPETVVASPSTTSRVVQQAAQVAKNETASAIVQAFKPSRAYTGPSPLLNRGGGALWNTDVPAVSRRLVQGTPSQSLIQKRFYSHSHQSGNTGKGRVWSFKDTLLLSTWLAGTAAFVWLQIRDEIPMQITGDLIEAPVVIENSGGTKHLIKHADKFEIAGEKENGRMPGAIVRRKDSTKFFVEKDMPNRQSALNEVVTGEAIHLLRGNKAPKVAFKQTPLGQGKAEFTVLSQILGHGREDSEPGRDLEKLAERYDVKEEFSQHPIRDFGVCVAMDLLFGKGRDAKLQNYVAYRRNSLDGHSYYYAYPIDNECGFWAAAHFSLDPEELLNAVKDVTPFSFDEKMHHAMMGKEDNSFSDSKMPLRGTVKAEIMRGILHQSIQEDIPYVAKMYEDFAALSRKQLEAIPAKLGGFVTDREKERYIGELVERQELTKQYIAENKSTFEALRLQRETSDKKEAKSKSDFVARFCRGEDVSGSILGEGRVDRTI